MAWQESLSWPRLVVFMILVFLMLSAVSSVIKHRKPLDLTSQHGGFSGSKDQPAWCPIPEPPLASPNDDLETSELFNQSLQVARLSAAVNIPTVSSGENGDVSTDPRWESFSKLHEVLKQQFPVV